MENFLTVIEELGSLLSKYKDEIKYKDYEIDNLKKKIEQIQEQFLYLVRKCVLI